MEFESPSSARNQLSDPHHPRYHFVSTTWMNDPDLFFWNGKHHVFYQHNPEGAFWGNLHWGHAVSEDLLHWEHLPIALAPGPESYDQEGCASGCVIDQGGIPTIFYTGYFPQAQCKASSADMIHWEKYSGNPMIAFPPEGLTTTGFRDPRVWKDGNNWYMIIGSGVKDVGGGVLMYQSEDLLHWNYIDFLYIDDEPGPLSLRTRPMTFEKEVILSWVQDPAEPEMYERPILCPLDKTHLLLVQVWNRTFYFTGRYEGLKYSPRLVGEIDPGGYFYSGETYNDHPNRCLLVGWLMEGRSKEAQLAAGWSGVMSLPRVLTLGDDQTLRYAPVPEVQKLRGANQHIESLRLGPEPVLLNEIKGLFLEISTVITPGSVGEISLLLRASPNLSEVTRLCYDIGGQHLYFDTRQSSQSGEVDRGIRGGTLRLHPGEPLRIRAFQDASVLEVIANERLCLTTRVYPVSENSTRVGFAASGDGTIIQAFDLWEMNC